MLHQVLGTPRLGHLKAIVQQLRADVESISRQLHGFADSLQNADIDGVRYLTDEAREKSDRLNRREEFNMMLTGLIEQARLKREAEATKGSTDQEG